MPKVSATSKPKEKTRTQPKRDVSKNKNNSLLSFGDAYHFGMRVSSKKKKSPSKFSNVARISEAKTKSYVESKLKKGITIDNDASVFLNACLEEYLFKQKVKEMDSNAKKSKKKLVGKEDIEKLF